MCDYSLTNVPNRLAEESETLVGCLLVDGAVTLGNTRGSL